MAKEDKNDFDQTEKELKYLIERAQNENSALSKILKVLTSEQEQGGEAKPPVGDTNNTLSEK